MDDAKATDGRCPDAMLLGLQMGGKADKSPRTVWEVWAKDEHKGCVGRETEHPENDGAVRVISIKPRKAKQGGWTSRRRKRTSGDRRRKRRLPVTERTHEIPFRLEPKRGAVALQSSKRAAKQYSTEHRSMHVCHTAFLHGVQPWQA